MTEQAIPSPHPGADLGAAIPRCAGIIAAAQRGVFQALTSGPRSVSELAAALGASEVGVARLAEMLAAVGYLERIDDRYANGPTPRAWLAGEGSMDATAYVL